MDSCVLLAASTHRRQTRCPPAAPAPAFFACPPPHAICLSAGRILRGPPGSRCRRCCGNIPRPRCSPWSTPPASRSTGVRAALVGSGCGGGGEFNGGWPLPYPCCFAAVCHCSTYCDAQTYSPPTCTSIAHLPLPSHSTPAVSELDRMGVDRQLLARRAVESYLQQLLNHGFFHADPHPGAGGG